MKGWWPDGLWLECRVLAGTPHIETNHTTDVIVYTVCVCVCVCVCVIES